jgi:hypothetical protein
MEYKFKAEQESLSSETESPSPLASISTDEKRIVRKLDFQFVMPFLLMACILKVK